MHAGVWPSMGMGKSFWADREMLWSSDGPTNDGASRADRRRTCFDIFAAVYPAPFSALDDADDDERVGRSPRAAARHTNIEERHSEPKTTMPNSAEEEPLPAGSSASELSLPSSSPSTDFCSSPTSSASFVYPVRSLLSRSIRPAYQQVNAKDAVAPRSAHGAGLRSASSDELSPIITTLNDPAALSGSRRISLDLGVQQTTPRPHTSLQRAHASRELTFSPSQSPTDISPDPSSSSFASGSNSNPSESSTSPPSSISALSNRPKKSKKNARNHRPIPGSNFRHFPGDEGLNTDRRFSSIHALSKDMTPSLNSSSGGGGNPPMTAGPTGEPVPTQGDRPYGGSEGDNFSPGHIPNFTMMTSGAFTSNMGDLVVGGSESSQSQSQSRSQHNAPSPVHMTDPTIVHLGARSSSSTGSNSGQPSGSAGLNSIISPAGSSHGTSSSSASVSSGANPPSSDQNEHLGSVAVIHSNDGSMHGGSAHMSNPSTDPSTGKSNVSGASQQSVTSGDELVTFRFEHNVDGDGHHVLTGREGKLARCEDEVSVPTQPSSFRH